MARLPVAIPIKPGRPARRKSDRLWSNIRRLVNLLKNCHPQFRNRALGIPTLGGGLGSAVYWITEKQRIPSRKTVRRNDSAYLAILDARHAA